MILINLLRKSDLIYVHLINVEEAVPNVFLFLPSFFLLPWFLFLVWEKSSTDSLPSRRQRIKAGHSSFWAFQLFNQKVLLTIDHLLNSDLPINLISFNVCGLCSEIFLFINHTYLSCQPQDVECFYTDLASQFIFSFVFGEVWRCHL